MRFIIVALALMAMFSTASGGFGMNMGSMFMAHPELQAYSAGLSGLGQLAPIAALSAMGGGCMTGWGQPILPAGTPSAWAVPAEAGDDPEDAQKKAMARTLINQNPTAVLCMCNEVDYPFPCGVGVVQPDGVAFQSPLIAQMNAAQTQPQPAVQQPVAPAAQPVVPAAQPVAPATQPAVPAAQPAPSSAQQQMAQQQQAQNQMLISALMTGALGDGLIDRALILGKTRQEGGDSNEAAAEAAEENKEAVAEVVEEVVDNAVEAAGDANEAAADANEEIVETVAENVSDAAENAGDANEAAADATEENKEAVADVVEEVVDNAVEAAGDANEAAADAASDAADDGVAAVTAPVQPAPAQPVAPEYGFQPVLNNGEADYDYIWAKKLPAGQFYGEDKEFIHPMGDPTKIWTQPDEMDIPVQFDLTTGTAKAINVNSDAPLSAEVIPSSFSPIPGMPTVGGLPGIPGFPAAMTDAAGSIYKFAGMGLYDSSDVSDLVENMAEGDFSDILENSAAMSLLPGLGGSVPAAQPAAPAAQPAAPAAQPNVAPANPTINNLPLNALLLGFDGSDFLTQQMLMGNGMGGALNPANMAAAQLIEDNDAAKAMAQMYGYQNFANSLSGNTAAAAPAAPAAAPAAPAPAAAQPSMAMNPAVMKLVEDSDAGKAAFRNGAFGPLDPVTRALYSDIVDPSDLMYRNAALQTLGLGGGSATGAGANNNAAMSAMLAGGDLGDFMEGDMLGGALVAALNAGTVANANSNPMASMAAMNLIEDSDQAKAAARMSMMTGQSPFGASPSVASTAGQAAPATNPATNNFAYMAAMGGDLGDQAEMQAAMMASKGVQSSGMNIMPGMSSDSTAKYVQGFNYLRSIGYPVDNMSPFYTKAAKKLIDDSVLGEDQGTFTINGQTYINQDKYVLASTRREQESQAKTKPFYENAFFWGTIVSWLVIVAGGVRYCQVSGKGLKENLLLDNLQEQQV